jgi:hypothetical protein
MRATVTRSSGGEPKQSNQKQQARDCSEHSRSKCVPRPGRWWVFGTLTAAGVPFGAGHSVALLASIACSMPNPAGRNESPSPYSRGLRNPIYSTTSRVPLQREWPISRQPHPVFRFAAHDRLEDNLNPVGRLYYSASTMICVPTSLAQEVGTALGAQAGEARLREVISKGGFTRMRRATETPFNMILEARP